ncbi:MAG: hypothetical protein AUJ21_08940 [Anaerolineae bacterium CG1_02_58_13]|nr:MAG: hypothetical protein AUJ21_08940 [Anaerolineae bacterium CG1_02_58_13]
MKWKEHEVHIGELISAFFTSDGPGGVVVITVVGLAAGIYFWLIRWILRGSEPEEKERYRSK